MSTVLFDNVGMTVTGAPGTGDVTLGVAIANPSDGYFQSFADDDAVGGELTIVRFEDDGAWEESFVYYSIDGDVASLTGRELIKSSTGEPLDLSADAKVFAVLTKAFFGGRDPVADGAKLDTIPEGGGSTPPPTLDSVGDLLGSAADFGSSPELTDKLVLLHAGDLTTWTWENFKSILGGYFLTLAAGVPATRTVNGHALSADVSVTKGDVGLGNVTNDAQLKAASNLSDVGSAATAFGNIKQAATTSASGVSEFATAAEYRTGTDTGRSLVVSEVWTAALAATLTDGANIAVDLSTGFNFGGSTTTPLNLGGNRTLSAPSNAKGGQSGILWFGASSSTRTLTLNAAWVVLDGVEVGPYSITTAQKLGLAYVVLGTTIYVTAILRTG
ncbi:MAG: hypothetical protein WDM94_09165 [Bauldia sp.]